jgi:hypothetical protein
MKEVIEGLKEYFQDVLAILLPGAFLSLILLKLPVLCDLQLLLSEFSENARLVAFLGVAYFIGHLLYYVGGKMDDKVDSRYVDRRLKPALVAEAERIKDAYINSAAKEAIGAFKFSCGWLLNNRKDMYAVVERHIAESKFFRSMTAALAISIPFLFIIKFKTLEWCDLIWLCALIFAIAMAITRYSTQRVKAIGRAFTYLIIAFKEEEGKKTFGGT